MIRRLLDRGVPRDHISVMGRNFQSETRIAGLISKKDVILGGLRTGAVFGSFLSLLTGVGVLFIPFVGPRGLLVQCYWGLPVVRSQVVQV